MAYSAIHTLIVWHLIQKLSNFMFSWQSILSGQKRYKQLERVVGINKKLEIVKLESFHLIWKVPIEVGKFSMQYSRSNQKFSDFGSNFPTSFFPISIRTFQLKSFQLLIFFQFSFPTACIPVKATVFCQKWPLGGDILPIILTFFVATFSR